MKYDELFNKCDLFQKLAGLVMFPIQTAKNMQSYVMDVYELWLDSKDETIHAKRKFNVTDFPYGFEPETLELIVQVKLHGNAKVDGKISYGRNQILIMIYSPRDSSKGVRSYMNSQIHDTVKHELMHYVQYLIGDQNVKLTYRYQERKNLPKKINVQTEEGADPNIEEIKRIQYLLDDTELQPWISTSANEFLTTCNYKPSKYQINLWVGNPNITDLTDQFFKALHEHAPKRWEYAVREFYKLVQNYIR